jgi:hypothetical protein
MPMQTNGVSQPDRSAKKRKGVEESATVGEARSNHDE